MDAGAVNERAEVFHGYLAVQARGTIALPPAIRKRYNMDRKGAQVEITEREDGVLELRPAVAVPAADAWFWDERWQAGEREVDAHVRAGEVLVSDGVEEFLSDLDALDGESGDDE
jgi:bifunctional DNA-binding transcriptional regulator/antitoxin component of YhaV-PrlF toxin-antitoxin module